MCMLHNIMPIARDIRAWTIMYNSLLDVALEGTIPGGISVSLWPNIRHIPHTHTHTQALTSFFFAFLATDKTTTLHLQFPLSVKKVIILTRMWEVCVVLTCWWPAEHQQASSQRSLWLLSLILWMGYHLTRERRFVLLFVFCALYSCVHYSMKGLQACQVCVCVYVHVCVCECVYMSVFTYRSWCGSASVYSLPFLFWYPPLCE